MMRLRPDVFQIETRCCAPKHAFPPNHWFPRLNKIHLFQCGTWTPSFYASIVMQLLGFNINFIFDPNMLGAHVVL